MTRIEEERLEQLIEGYTTWAGTASSEPQVHRDTASALLELKELRAQGGVTNLATAIRAFMPLAQVAFLWTKETPPEAEVSQYRETYNNVLRALSALETEAVAECATEGCERPATNRFEAGGVGSTYCGECFAKVIEIVDPPHSSISTVTGELIAAAQNVYDKCASETGTVTILDQERLGDALRALSSESK